MTPVHAGTPSHFPPPVPSHFPPPVPSPGPAPVPGSAAGAATLAAGPAPADLANGASAGAFGLPLTEVAVLVVAGLLPLAFVPGLLSPLWTPKVAVALVGAGLGLPALLRAARVGDRPARWGLAWVAAAALAAAVSPDVRLAVFGRYAGSGGVAFVVVLVAWWAAGTTLGERARRVLDVELVALGSALALVAWLQSVVAIPVGPLALHHGERAGALTGNPVQLGALLAATGVLTVVLAGRSSARRFPVLAAALGVQAGAIQLAGSRAALAVFVLGTVVALWSVRAGAVRSGAAKAGAVRRPLVLGLMVVAGLLAGGLRSDHAGTDRVVGSSSGVGDRAEMWRLAFDAFGEHPWLGVGPARTWPAISPRLGEASTLHLEPDTIVSDAHNAAVEYLLTTGIVGAAAAAAFVLAGARRARGARVWVPALVGAVWLVEPQFVGLTPLAFLVLGSAGPVRAITGPAPPRRRPRRAGLAPALLAFGGLVVGGVLVAGDRALWVAQADDDLAAAQSAGRLLAPWSMAPALEAEVALRRALAGEAGAAERAVRAATRAAQHDPHEAFWWKLLGDVAYSVGDRDTARRAYERALDLDPVSVRAATGLAALSGAGPGAGTGGQGPAAPAAGSG